MIGKCPRSRFKSLNIASIQHARSHTPKKTNFEIAAAEVIGLAETGADGGVPRGAAHGLAHDAAVAQREPISGPSEKKLGSLRWRWWFGFGLGLVEKRTCLLVIGLLIIGH